MKAYTKNYVYPAATVHFTAFDKEITIGSVYGITTIDNGNVYINSAEYPFHYELSDTVITVIESGISYSEYTVEFG